MDGYSPYCVQCGLHDHHGDAPSQNLTEGGGWTAATVSRRGPV